MPWSLFIVFLVAGISAAALCVAAEKRGEHTKARRYAIVASIFALVALSVWVIIALR